VQWCENGLNAGRGLQMSCCYPTDDVRPVSYRCLVEPEAGESGVGVGGVCRELGAFSVGDAGRQLDRLENPDEIEVQMGELRPQTMAQRLAAATGPWTTWPPGPGALGCRRPGPTGAAAY